MVFVEVLGVGRGTTILTVQSESDPSKSSTIEVEVVDTSITTSSVGKIPVGEVEEIWVSVNPEIPGATVTWRVSDVDPGYDEAFVEITPYPNNDRRALIKGIVSGGGGRVQAVLNYNGLSWSDSSRVSVVAKPVSEG